MLRMFGKVLNIYTVEAGKDKDGKEYPESHKVQLLGELTLPNGDVRHEIVDLKIDNLEDWKSCKGHDIFVDVGVYSLGKNMTVFFVKKGAKPNII